MVDGWLTFKTQVYLKKMILLALVSSSFFLVSEVLPQPVRIAAQVAYWP